jgi:chromosomal replication initiation ATPase DnaA
MRTQRIRTHVINYDVVPKIITDGVQLIPHCAELFKINPQTIYGQVRLTEIVAIRHSIMWICRRKLKMTQAGIGRLLMRDHATVIHAVRSVDNWIEMSKHYPEQMNIFNHIIANCIFTEGVNRVKSVQYLKTTMQHLQAELNRLELMEIES